MISDTISMSRTSKIMTQYFSVGHVTCGIVFGFLFFLMGSYLPVIQFVQGAENIVKCVGSDLCSGTEMDDVIIGNNASNIMTGLDGADVMLGWDGDDSMSGGNRTDQMIGDEGDDKISGGDGSDEIIGGTGNDRISGGNGADEILGGDGTDIILGNNGPDSIMGGASDDTIVGGLGTDTLNGEDGDDKIYQGSVKSTSPDGSQDVIICGEGKDEAWLNFSVDRDLASDDCEIIHKG